MSESIATLEAPVANEVPVVTKKVRKTSTKANKKASEVKAAKEKPVALTLRFQQIRILKALNKAARPLNRSEIGAKANINGGMTAHLGPVIVEDIKEVEKNNGHACLLGLGYVKRSSESVNDQDITYYEISAAGRKALDTINNDPTWPAGH